jgi:hypothetical protein
VRVQNSVEVGQNIGELSLVDKRLEVVGIATGNIRDLIPEQPAILRKPRKITTEEKPEESPVEEPTEEPISQLAKEARRLALDQPITQSHYFNEAA